MMIFSVIAMLYSMGFGGVMVPLARQAVNASFRSAGMNY